MPTRTHAGASARTASRRRAPARRKSASPKRNPRKSALRKSAPRAIKAPPPPRAADPRARKTGRRRNCYTPEFLAEAKRRVEETAQATTALAGDLGMHHSVLSRLIEREGWVRPEGSLRLRSLSPAMRLAAQADALTGASAHSRESGNPATGTQASERGSLGPRLRGDERSEVVPDNATIDRLEA